MPIFSFTWSLYLRAAKVLIIWKIAYARIALSQSMVPTAHSQRWCRHVPQLVAIGWFRLVSKVENGQHTTTPTEIGVNTSSFEFHMVSIGFECSKRATSFHVFTLRILGHVSRLTINKQRNTPLAIGFDWFRMSQTGNTVRPRQR